MEGIRIAGTFGSYRQYTGEEPITVNDFGEDVEIKPGDKVFTSFVGANRDPERFPDPEEVKVDRPIDSYIHYGIGPHTCLGMEASRVALTTMLKTVCKLDNLRRAPGLKGILKKIPRYVLSMHPAAFPTSNTDSVPFYSPGGFCVYMKEDEGSYFPFPLNMQVNWDGELPPIPTAPGKTAGPTTNGKTSKRASVVPGN
jgi:hypothetical protein